MKKMKALVIDDEEIVLNSVKKILGAENYDVDTANNGETGIRMAITDACDIVLTDIRMPDIGGLIVLRDVKRQKPTLPVIIITGYASVQSAVEAMKLGAADYITKPFTPDQLAEAVATAIAQAKLKEPEIQAILHKEEVLRVLDRAAEDHEFRHGLLISGADMLSEYELTGPEKLAILTGDIRWIEEQIGKLAPARKIWLNARLAAEIW
jgi:DNA-binding NtrC family response regulator